MIEAIRQFFHRRKQDALCKIGQHLWIEWEHSNDRPRHHFIYLTAVLKNPECCHCGAKKYKTKKERKAYEKRMREELKAHGYALTAKGQRVQEDPNHRRWQQW